MYELSGYPVRNSREHGEQICCVGISHNSIHSSGYQLIIQAMSSHRLQVQWFWLTLGDLLVESHGVQIVF